MIYVITLPVKCALSQRSSSNPMAYCLAAYIWTGHGGQKDALFPGKADQIRSTACWKATGYHASRGTPKNTDHLVNIPKESIVK